MFAGLGQMELGLASIRPEGPQGIPAAGPCRYCTQRRLQGDTRPLFCCSDTSLAPLRPQKVPQPVEDWDRPQGDAVRDPPNLCRGAQLPALAGPRELWPSQCSALQRGGDRGWQCWGTGGTRTLGPDGRHGVCHDGGGGEGPWLTAGFPAPWKHLFLTPMQPSQALLNPPSILPSRPLRHSGRAQAQQHPPANFF